MNQFPQLLIFSLNLDFKQVPALFHEMGINPGYLKGLFKGKHETSYVLNIPSTEHRDYKTINVLELCRANGQKCVLFVDSNRGAYLEYLKTGKHVDKGTLKVSDKMPNSDYSFDPETKKYWYTTK